MSALNQIRFNLATVTALILAGKFSKARFVSRGLARGLIALVS